MTESVEKWDYIAECWNELIVAKEQEERITDAQVAERN